MRRRGNLRFFDPLMNDEAMREVNAIYALQDNRENIRAFMKASIALAIGGFMMDIFMPNYVANPGEIFMKLGIVGMFAALWGEILIDKLIEVFHEENQRQFQ